VINPNKIPPERMPLIVLSDHSSGFVQWIIKWRTKAHYNHIMSMIWMGEFASQGNLFSSIPISRYMTQHSRLKFWMIKDLTGQEEELIRKRIGDRLDLPKWKRRYNLLGIFGQATGLRWISSPWVPYCSQQVLRDVLEGVITLSFIHEGEIIELSRNPSPKESNDFFKKHPRMEVYGRWSAD